jgi:hypothetical protein
MSSDFENQILTLHRGRKVDRKIGHLLFRYVRVETAALVTPCSSLTLQFGFRKFCTNDPETLLASAKIVEPYCDAVDINFGCPQDIARRGKYGCFLQDDWDLIYKLSEFLHLRPRIKSYNYFTLFSQYFASESEHTRYCEISGFPNCGEDRRLCQDDGERRCSDPYLSWSNS